MTTSGGDEVMQKTLRHAENWLKRSAILFIATLESYDTERAIET